MIHFSRYTKWYFLCSLLVIGVGLFSILRYGYNIAIDFTGGTKVTYELASPQQVQRQKLEEIVHTQKAQLVESIVSHTQLELRMTGFEDTKEPKLRQDLGTLTKGTVTLSSFESVGPTIGADSIRKTYIAAILGIVIMLGYIFYAFKRLSFALAAIGALIHDMLVVLGMYSLLSHFFGAQFDTLFVTALLTTMTFSTHDTIVIFDNIRDALRRGASHEDIHVLADKAVSATMVRSLNNSLTIIFMLVALVALGGSTIRFFALALLIGTITGVYSSPFVATPLMIFIEKWRARTKN